MNSGQVLPPNEQQKKSCGFWSYLDLGLLGKTYRHVIISEREKPEKVKMKEGRRLDGVGTLQRMVNKDLELKVKKKDPYTCRRESKHEGTTVELGLYKEHEEGSYG